jgi:hypothetical protein
MEAVGGVGNDAAVRQGGLAQVAVAVVDRGELRAAGEMGAGGEFAVRGPGVGVAGVGQQAVLGVVGAGFGGGAGAAAAGDRDSWLSSKELLEGAAHEGAAGWVAAACRPKQIRAVGEMLIDGCPRACALEAGWKLRAGVPVSRPS